MFFFLLFQRTVKFLEQLSSIIPNSHVYYRRGLALKKIIPQCIARDFTDLIVINEDRKIASILQPSVSLYICTRGELQIPACFNLIGVMANFAMPHGTCEVVEMSAVYINGNPKPYTDNECRKPKSGHKLGAHLLVPPSLTRFS